MAVKKSKTKVGEFLHNLREERHETLNVVGKRLGYSTNWIWRVENGNDKATSQFLKKLVTEYELDKDHLIDLFAAVSTDFLVEMFL